MSLLLGEVEGSFFFGGVEDCKAVNRYTGMRLWGHYNTVATLVKLLVEKGFVSYRTFGNTYRYEAKITEKEYKGSTIGQIVSQYFGNSYTKVVSQFIEDEKIDLEELKQLIAQIEQGKTDRKS